MGLQFPQPLLLYQGSGPRVNNSPSYLARGQNCWNCTFFHINVSDCLTAREKEEQLSASNLKELFLNSWKKYIFQTRKSNMKNVYFPNIVYRKRKLFYITVITQGFPLIITFLTTFIHWLLIQLSINTHFVYVAYREVTKNYKSCSAKKRVHD